MENKKALKSILYNISSPEEREGFSAFEMEGLDGRLDTLHGLLAEAIDSSGKSATQEQMQELNSSLKKFKGEFAMFLKNIADAQESQNKALTKAFGDLGKSLKDVQPKDYSGFFKDFPTLLTQIGNNTAGTKQVIQNLKWNASQQLRDVNGSPINPAIASFGITQTYDDVVLAYTGDNLTTVTYKQNGQVKAVLTLTYSGDNLVEVQRTT